MIPLKGYDAWLGYNEWPDEILEGILQEFDKPDIWNKKHIHRNSRKLASNQTELWEPSTRKFFEDLNSKEFTTFLSDLTGVPELVADHTLQGGGLHKIEVGGFLGIHTDFVKHPQFDLYRRLNLLIYLNKDWQGSWGGHLELWEGDRHPERKVASIAPKFNASVLFKTTDKSWHGHPSKLKCPPEQSRKSLALYYYTKERPDYQISTNTVYDISNKG